MSPVGLWRDEDGDLHEIRRRPHGYIVLCTTPDGDPFEVRDVRWRADRLKWTLVIPAGPDGEDSAAQLRDAAHRKLRLMTVKWKSSGRGRRDLHSRHRVTPRPGAPCSAVSMRLYAAGRSH
ncbi:MAG: hypothetical protein R3F43_17140 [bacterium]